MPALPPSTTARVWVHYNDGVYNHSIQMRPAAAVPASAALAVIQDFLEAIEGALYNISITGVEVAGAGTDVRNPMGWTGAAEYGTGVMPAVNAPRELRWQFRSTDGRQGSLSMFGGNFATPDNYRFLPTVSADYDAGVTVLTNAAVAGQFVTISGLAPVVKNYVSVNFNSYWEAERRG